MKAMKVAMSATAVHALLLLDLPSTRLLICSGECYLIRKPRPRYLTAKVYDALYHAGFISHPQARSGELAECLMTPEGHAVATKIREDMSDYYQLCLFEEDKEEAEASKSTQTQLCLFDENAEGAA